MVVELTTTFLTLPALAGLLLLAEAEAAADGLVLLSPFTLAAASCCLALTLTKATSSMETLGSAHSGRTGRRLTLGVSGPPSVWPPPPTDVRRGVNGLSLEARRSYLTTPPPPPPVSMTTDFMALLLLSLLFDGGCWAWKRDQDQN